MESVGDELEGGTGPMITVGSDEVPGVGVELSDDEDESEAGEDAGAATGSRGIRAVGVASFAVRTVPRTPYWLRA
jgi:hypothetical protein